MQFTWPLVGRSDEARLIHAAISAPASSGIVICGSAGVGKSRLAREALSWAATNKYETRWVVATSSAQSLPLGALYAWAGSDAADSLQLVRRVIGALTDAPAEATVVVGVDDAQLLDDLSTFVLHQIVQRRMAKLVVTVRDNDPIPAAVQELWKAARFDRLDLQPLSKDESIALASTRLPSSVDPDSADRLWKLTRGNPLYLCTILEQEISDGRLVQEGGQARWVSDPVLPPGLVQLIESRTVGLPAVVSDVIDALAVGEPLELAVLTRITDAAAVEEADVRGLIAVSSVDHRIEVRLAHPMYGEVRKRRAPATRLRRLRGLVATELAASNTRDDLRTVVRCAALSMESDIAPDPKLLIRAAQGAVFLADLGLADRLADAAIRAGGGPEANFIRAHGLSWLGCGEQADAVLAAIPSESLSDADRATLAFVRSANRLFALADPRGAKKLIDDAAVVTPPDCRTCVDAFLTVYWSVMGKPGEASQSMTFELESLPAVVGALPAMALATAHGDVGRTSDAVRVAEAGYVVATRSLDAAHMRFGIAAAHVCALLQAGMIAEASLVAERIHEQAVDLPGAARLLSTAVAGRAALGAGALRQAVSLLEPVVAVLTAAGDANGVGYSSHLQLTIARAMRGMTDRGANELAALEAHRHPSYQFLDYELAVARAWFSACQGAVTEAIRIVLAAAGIARGNGQFAAEVVCLQHAGQFGDGSSTVRLRELQGIVEGPRVGLAARFAAALAVGDGAELVAVSEQFERMGDSVAAVDAAAHAAIAYRRQQLRGSALSCSTRAEALAEQCGANTPALRQASERLSFSDREREIIMLLGEGLSSPAIAERLNLSPRTVEGHIYRAMAKTGTSRRGDLAALLPRRHPSSRP